MELTYRHNDRWCEFGRIGVITGSDTPTELNVDFRFGKGSPSNSFQDMVHPLRVGIGLRQVKCRRTAIQSSEMGFECERMPLVGTDHFVDAIAKLKASIFDRDFRLGQRHERSIDEGHIRHDYALLRDEPSETVTSKTRRSSAVNFHPMRFSNTTRWVPALTALNSNVRCPLSTALFPAMRR